MASSSGAPAAQAAAAAASGPASNQGAAFPLPLAQCWRWLCLPALEGQVTVRLGPAGGTEPGSGSGSEAPAPGADEEEEAARVLALVRDGGAIGEWIEPEEESSSSDDEDDEEEGSSGDEDENEDEDARRQKKLLPRLALRKQEGGAASDPLVVLETVGWSNACALTHALAHKALVRDDGDAWCLDSGLIA